jgi:hypothetical protein
VAGASLQAMPQPPILPPQDGFLFLGRDKFHASFAGDLPAGQAACWYLVTTGDRMIPPAAQWAMAGRLADQAGRRLTSPPAHP